MTRRLPFDCSDSGQSTQAFTPFGFSHRRRTVTRAAKQQNSARRPSDLTGRTPTRSSTEGLDYIDQGNLEMGIVCMTKADVIEPGYVSAYLNQGTCLFAVGEPEKAA